MKNDTINAAANHHGLDNANLVQLLSRTGDDVNVRLCFPPATIW